MRNLNQIATDLNSSKKVLVIGAAFVDIIVNIDKMPKSGGDVTGEYKGASVGGCAFNVADVLNKLKLPFDIFIPVGGGPYSKPVKEIMQQNGYPIYVEVTDHDNGWCMSLVEKNGERAFISVPGIETKMQFDWFDRFDMKSFDFIYVSGYEMEGANGNILMQALKRKRDDAIIVFDPGPRTAFIGKDVLNGLFSIGTLLTLNGSEAIELSGEKTVELAGNKLYNITKHPVIITLGGQGAMICKDTNVTIPGFSTTVVDTIGAGDSHTGGIIAGLSCNLSLDESVYLANKVASVVVSQIGAATAPTIKDLK